jgi:hypothetical protein
VPENGLLDERAGLGRTVGLPESISQVPVLAPPQLGDVDPAVQQRGCRYVQYGADSAGSQLEADHPPLGQLLDDGAGVGPGHQEPPAGEHEVDGRVG